MNPPQIQIPPPSSSEEGISLFQDGCSTHDQVVPNMNNQYPYQQQQIPPEEEELEAGDDFMTRILEE